MSKGELSPKLHARVDSQIFRQGLKLCRNFSVMVPGGIQKRSGTRWVTPAALNPANNTSPIGKLMPFTFSETQAYVLEFGDQQLGFIYQGGVVESSPGVRYTIQTPYNAEDLDRLTGTQSADVVYLVHPDYPIHKLERRGETDWRIVPLNIKNGPWLDVNDSDNDIDPNGLLKPSISATSNQGSGASNTLVENVGVYWRWNSKNHGYWLRYDLGFNAYPCNGYIITGATIAWDDQSRVVYTYPREWTLEGANSTSGPWVVLDRRFAESDWQRGETRAYYFDNDKAYRYLRLDVTKGNGEKENHAIGHVNFSFKGRPGSIDFLNTDNVNRGEGLNAGDVGRQVRWQGQDGFWRIFTITGIVNSTTANGTWEGFWIWEDKTSRAWQLGAFSENSGYPKSVTIFQERLTFAGTKAQPRTVFMSASGDYEDFELPDPLSDDSPITVTVAGSRQDQIEWLREVEDMLMVATTDNVLSIAGTENNVITPTSIRQKKHAGFGAQPKQQPVRVGPIVLFPGFHGQTFHELVYDAQLNGYDAPNVAVLADHLFKSKVRDLSFSQVPLDVIYIVNGDGDMMAMTYERAQQVVGFGLFDFPNAEVMSIATIPELGTDATYLLMRRYIDDRWQHYIERLERPFDYGTDADAWFLDSALPYSGAATNIITGLSHLEGQTVRVYGWDATPGDQFIAHPAQEEYVVVGGQIELSMPVTYALVGIPYKAHAKMLPPAAIDVEDGSGYGRKVRVDGVTVSFLNSRSVRVQSGVSDIAAEDLLKQTMSLYSNTDLYEWLFNSLTTGIQAEEMILREGEMLMDSYVPLFTGDKTVNIDDSWDGGGEIEIVSDEPHPCIVRAISIMVDREPGRSLKQGG